MRVSCDTIQEKGKEEERGGGTKRSLGKRGSRDREGASAGGPGGFNDFLLVACSGPKNAGPSRPMVCRGLAGPCKSGPQKSPVVRWTPVGAPGGDGWELETLKHKPCRAATVCKPGNNSRFTGTHTVTHTRTATHRLHTPLRLKPVDCKVPRGVFKLHSRIQSACFPD